jgi:hypothetical protein
MASFMALITLYSFDVTQDAPDQGTLVSATAVAKITQGAPRLLR